MAATAQRKPRKPARPKPGTKAFIMAYQTGAITPTRDEYIRHDEIVRARRAAQRERERKQSLAYEARQMAARKRKAEQDAAKYRRELARRNREAGESARQQYAKLAREKPYEKWKRNGAPWPVLGPPKTTYNAPQGTAGKGAGKAAGAAAKLARAYEDPQAQRERAARNTERVRVLRSKVNDLEIDVRHAGFAVQGAAPGTKEAQSARAAYNRKYAALLAAVKEYEAAYQAALSKKPRAAARRKAA